MPSYIYNTMAEISLQSVYDEIARMRPERSTSPHSAMSVPYSSSSKPKSDGKRWQACTTMKPRLINIELRDLAYIDPEPHLQCPICHITLIDPVSLECSHWFCEDCLDDYWKTTLKPGSRKACPACRSTAVRKRRAPRITINMCNEVKVRCPSKGCHAVVTREALESHLVDSCRELEVVCPGLGCRKRLKAKQLDYDKCRHETHVECECEEFVLREELERHRETVCSSREVQCEHCEETMSHSQFDHHTCASRAFCSGKEFGCDTILDRQAMEEHSRTCIIAKMTPNIQRQISHRLEPLENELRQAKQRAAFLEDGVDRFLEIIDTEMRFRKMRQNQTMFDVTNPATSDPTDPLTASTVDPSPSASHKPPTATLTGPHPQESHHHHLLALHETLQATVNSTITTLHQLQQTVSEVDARNSMLTMNETMRIKEELAITNNALYSTRAQVNWLLNRERASQQQQQTGVRGRTANSTAVGSTQASSGDEAQLAVGNGNGSGSAATPAWTSQGVVAAMVGAPARRRSGGSQERVKL
jgi:Zinc finger, C3HC4 type (RING finger)/TRAF-type zinc finger